MTTNLDAVVRGLFDKFEARKKSVEALRATLSAKWATNCQFPRIGGYATSTNLQTASREVIEACARELAVLQLAEGEVEKQLKITGSAKHGGYAFTSWWADMARRMAAIQVSGEEAELATLEQRLEQVLSPEERRRMEIERLAASL